MLGPSWITLFRRLPPALHDTLVMITATGAEVMIQRILILESDYMVFRGRMSGVQDNGLVMMMPYDQISNVAFARRMLEPELRQIFSGSEFLVSGAAAAPPAEEKTAETQDGAVDSIEEEPVEQEQEATTLVKKEETKAPDSTGRPNQPSKSTLLAKLRARLAGQAKS